MGHSRSQTGLAKRGLKSKLAVISGLDWEAAAFRSGCGSDFPGTVKAFGVGPEAAAQAARQQIADGACALISWGSAGGLTDLPSGAIVIGSSVCDVHGQAILARAIEDESLFASLGAVSGLHRGKILGVDEPVLACKDKRALGERTGALVVDMESHALAAVAREYGLPLLVCRVVLDASDRFVPAMVMNAVHGSRARIAPIVAGLLRRPNNLPAILKLGVDARRARRRLRALAEPLAPALSRWIIDKETKHG